MRQRTLLIACAGIALLGIVALPLLPTGEPPGGPEVVESLAASSDPQDAPLVATVPPADPSQPLAVESGGRLHLDSSALPIGAAVEIDLLLDGNPIVGDEPLSGRVVAADGRVIDISASASPGERAAGRIVLEPGWLTPGRYIVEIVTREHTILPIRRYVLEVR